MPIKQQRDYLKQQQSLADELRKIVKNIDQASEDGWLLSNKDWKSYKYCIDTEFQSIMDGPNIIVGPVFSHKQRSRDD